MKTPPLGVVSPVIGVEPPRAPAHTVAAWSGSRAGSPGADGEDGPSAVPRSRPSSPPAPLALPEQVANPPVLGLRHQHALLPAEGVLRILTGAPRTAAVRVCGRKQRCPMTAS